MPAASTMAPRNNGSWLRAMSRMTVSEAARPIISLVPRRPGFAARPVIASNASAVSMMTTPITIPATARRAAFSSLAEKNFWYIPLSPSNRRNVGMAMPTTQSQLCPPRIVVCSAGSLSMTPLTPPSFQTMYGSAKTTPTRMAMPLKMSTETIDTMPAIAVNRTMAKAVISIPCTGVIAPSVTIASIHPPPRNW